MNTLKRTLLACVLTAASAAWAAGTPSPCDQDPKARGIPERLENIRRQMDRIEWTSDAVEQRALLDLHTKTMQEGLRELRRRQTSEPCRVQMMHAMMEQMLRHQLAVSEVGR